MNKRVAYIVGSVLFILILFFILILVSENYQQEQEDLKSPHRISSYQKFGYFKIEPETILVSLTNGNTDVFIPLQEDDALALDELTDLSIYWTQDDFLEIASTLGRQLWNDPMELTKWSVFNIFLTGHCGDHLGFDFAHITYFKTGKNYYTTRSIKITPNFGLVSWGDGNTYHQPIFRKWESIDLLGANNTADDALQIINKDLKRNFNIKENICGVTINSSPENPRSWRLHVVRGSLDPILYIVNFETGDYTSKEINK